MKVNITLSIEPSELEKLDRYRKVEGQLSRGQAISRLLMLSEQGAQVAAVRIARIAQKSIHHPPVVPDEVAVCPGQRVFVPEDE